MKKSIVCLVVAVVLAGVGKARAVVIDYDTTIDYTINGPVEITEGSNPNPPTTVEIVEPADLQDGISVYDSSIVNIRGGTIHSDEDMGLSTADDSTVNIYDGILTSEVDMEIGGSSTLNIYGGTVEDEVQAADFATVNIYGGYVDDLDGADSSLLNIFGGEVHTPNVSGLSVLNVFGGNIDSLLALDSGRVYLYGIDFNYPYGAIPDASGILTGTLKNGDPINAPFEILFDASIVLAVPEPSTLALLSIGAVGLLGYTLRRRR
ncbi:MAG: PEP-CTERM sorting domain-containing protein [Thermoguttaceae bacterium]